MIGLGGGVIKGPLLIEMGCEPSVVAATSTTMILFTSLTALSSYVGYGNIKIDYALLLFFIGALSSCVSHLVSRGTPGSSASLITLTMGIVTAISAILMTTEVGISLRNHQH
jgi:uncharacterized membrane protein YfcA